jgi:hypothetical protein
MADVLIRGVPAEELAKIDEQAARAGLSRVEFLRRELHALARRRDVKVDVAHLVDFSAVFVDLTDAEVMSKAWD